jgi:hypothetical protein
VARRLRRRCNLLDGAKAPKEIRARILNLAEYDQRAWLDGMGDEAPVAKALKSDRTETIDIGGAQHVVYEQDMDSHRDISNGDSPIAKKLGMPPENERAGLKPFHDLVLHTALVPWYDKKRNVTILVYWVTARYRDANGRVHDGSAPLDRELRTAARGAHAVDLAR